MPATDVRPWLRRDTLFADSGTGVRISNPVSGFEIVGPRAYALFRMIHPFLDGSMTIGQLESGFTAEQWAKVESILTPLADHGFVRWIPDADFAALDPGVAETFAEQIAFLAQYSDEPNAAFARFRVAPVHILGATPMARSIAENLVANGSAGTVVVPFDDDFAAPASTRLADAAELAGAEHLIVTPSPAALAWFAAEGRRIDRRTVLAVVPGGERLWALPHPWGDDDPALPDWGDALAALEAGGALGGLEETWLTAAAGHPVLGPRTGSEPVQRMLGALLAYEAFKGLSGALAPETARHAIELDAATGETRGHRVHPHPAGRPLELTPTAPPAEGFGETGTIDDSLAEEVGAWLALADPASSRVAGFDDEDVMQLPLKIGVARLADGREERAASLWTAADARIEALARVYAELVSELESGPAGSQSAGIELRRRDGGTITTPAARLFRRSSANHDGRHPRAPFGAGVGLREEHALERACRSSAVEALLAAAVTHGAVPFDWDDDGAAASFLRDSAPVDAALALFDLGTVDDWHGVLAAERTGGVFRWEAAARRTRGAATIAAVTELLGAHQDPSPPDPATPTMRALPHLDPRRFAAADAPAELPGRMHAVTVASAAFDSLGLRAALSCID
ncbi:hypothetical protein [Agromyces archimandritae]|uniref:YcaO domain-containing protein n=1 Tax=Agromyces archimandritae TaxID=2781962 RepID=A0A975FLH0_9MICO|nr:hypothetical protein [Agromyces archimandritae]QTX04076.1 hypothetical protein G127AT_12345 [Agromyces archimandritae]